MRYVTPSGSVYALYQTMLDQPHLLVAGATGSGKSVLINSLIGTALYGSPARVRLVLLDPKTTELWQWESVPHTISYGYELDDMLRQLRDTIGIMDTRLHHMHAVGERLWSGAQIYVIIDELGDLLTTAKIDALPLLQRLLNLGRAAGIHLIMGTQCLLSSVLPTQLRVNIPSVVCLRTATKQQSRFIIDRPGAELFPNPRTSGKAFGFFRQGADVERFTVHRVDDNEQMRLVNWWKDPAHTI